MDWTGATTRSDGLSVARSSGPSSCLGRTRKIEAAGGYGSPKSEVAQFVVGAEHSIGVAPKSGILRARVDPLTREQRSHQMSLVRAKHTHPEKLVRAALTRLGYRYRLHPRNVPGRPDIVIRRLRSAILVHGCFWHRHKGCTRTRRPKTRVDFWSKKFSNNIARDRSVRSQLRRDGWKTLVVWECASEDSKTLERRLKTFLGGHS